MSRPSGEFRYLRRTWFLTGVRPGVHRLAVAGLDGIPFCIKAAAQTRCWCNEAAWNGTTEGLFLGDAVGARAAGFAPLSRTLPGNSGGPGTVPPGGLVIRGLGLMLPGAALCAPGPDGEHRAVAGAGGDTDGPARSRPGGGDGPGGPVRWLAGSMAALGVLAAASAVVSYAAQYRLVLAVKATVPVAALEAAIPDVAALVFACLGIALARHGRRAIRARTLNLAAVAASVTMNVLAAGPGWRDLAVWALPPVAYALASDTAISVIRTQALTQRAGRRDLADGEPGPFAIVGGLARWLLRLIVAPSSTLAGLRGWVLEECPVAPGRRDRSITPSAARPQASERAPAMRGAGRRPRQEPRAGTKTARFLALAAERHGPLAAFPLADVARVSAELATAVGLHPGAARSALRRHVQSLQNRSTP